MRRARRRIGESLAQFEPTLIAVEWPAEVAKKRYGQPMLSFGSGDDQPCVALLTAWHRRNFILGARLAQQVKPGDRAMVIFGAGHAFLLRQCMREMPAGS